MNLYYIENSFKHVNLLKFFTKSNVNIMAIKSIEDLKSDDILIISKDSTGYDQQLNKLPNIILWEDMYEKLYNYSLNRYMVNYDFYYLKYSLKRALEPDVKSIVVGSSYARFGLEESIINEPCINLALASQDMYYACQLGRYVISENPNIEKVFIGTGYYSFHSDLSLCQAAELMRISDVYYPILGDMHNCKELPQSRNSILADTQLFDIPKIVDIFYSDFFQQFKGNYFVGIRSRFNLRMNLKEAGSRKWSELEDALRKECAYERAESHNKVIKYIDSYKENKEILNSFVTYCNERNVKVCVVAFPGTGFYKEHLLKEFKEEYMSALDSIDGVVNFIDYNESDMFTDEDFVDMDHLDISGAIKISGSINQLSL